jgi:tRNA pseudouridine55 synthase
MKTSFHGLLVLNKPRGITSRDAVNRAQAWFPRGTRMGHTGTLDPLATGVLVLCVGAATRLTELVQQMDKTYRTRLLLGARSDTDDADGQITALAGVSPPGPGEVEEALRAFMGEVEQVPPAYSAAKVTGRRAYDLARRGEDVSLGPRRVRIYAIDLLAYAWPRLELEVRCGKGTYIRSLARDLGERLGCGALVQMLRRTRVGPFEAASGLDLDADAATARARLLPVAAAVTGMPRVSVTAAQASRLRQGQGVPLHQLPPSAGLVTGDAEMAVFTGDTLVGLGRVDAGKGLLLPAKMLTL